MEEQPQQIILQTSRFTYSEAVVEQLSKFAKIHEYDSRVDFKEAWKKWIEESDIKKLLTEEISKLTKEGLKGEIIDRMYKSARYYYRKKTELQSKPVHQRKEYEGLPRNILQTIDDHIYEEINKSVMENDKVSGYVISNISQAGSFISYCKQNYDVITDLLKENKNKEEKQGNLREELKVVTDKLKKTYKNRFYKIKVTLQKEREMN
jgi:hypothetical protein